MRFVCVCVGMDSFYSHLHLAVNILSFPLSFLSFSWTMKGIQRYILLLNILV